jgi:hypothetical protein
MGAAKFESQGFTLIAGLLVLALLSAVAVGLLFMVSGAGQVGGNDLENNLAYYGAESGMEKLTADLSALYQQKPAAQAADIQALANNTPDNTMVANMTYSEQITWPQSDANGNPKSQLEVIENGQNAGLSAEVIPLTLQVRASRPSGAEVSMVRTVQVVLIPVFQFGVFSDSDLSYFAGPQFDFQGRVHTNGNLFLAANNGPLILGDKVTAVGEIVRDRLANNFSNGTSYQGNVFAPTASGGCDPPGLNTNPKCKSFVISDASWSGGIPTGTGSANQYWGTDVAPWNSMINIHVHTLQLPFVQGNPAQQVQIVRKPPAGEAVSSALGSSREYNKATIRILLADTQADLHPDHAPVPPANDGSDVQLETLQQVQNVSGTPNGSTSFLAVADPGNTGDPNLNPPTCNHSVQGPNCAVNNTWPLVKGWLRVEYLDNASGNWVGVTNEWLSLGFAKSPYVARTAPGVDTNAHPNAILILQQLADRDGNRSVTTGPTPNGSENQSITGSNNNFYPINFYDPREGEPRDNPQGLNSPTCRVNGIMNAVELDVGNLNQWLINSASGKKINYLSQNGYLLYFSDRRGMVRDPNAGNLTYGEYGFEDVINSGSGNGTPDGALEAQSNGLSPEDVDQNHRLDAWGGANVGDGFGVNTNTNPINPYQTVDCMNGGRQSWVSGARHVLRLVDGALGNLSVRPDNGQGGFTVASENPVYVEGDYNTNAGDPFWTNAQAPDIPHAAAAIIADSVTLLSNNWSDLTDMKNTLRLNNRPATNTYYRMAMAAGKNINFPQPNGTGNDFGTDGGVHNFLRYIESWQNGNIVLGYRGSLVSLYYSQYATGIFKCCTLVYEPPKRQYFFDTAFLNPQNLPPGTPMLQDVENLSYWQDFSPRQPGQ